MDGRAATDERPVNGDADGGSSVSGRPVDGAGCVGSTRQAGTAGTNASRVPRALGRSSPAALAAVLVALALGGCASAQKRDCLSGDWEGLGLRDGREGRGFERVGELAERCSDYDVTLDSAAWNEGYERGVAEYCKPSRGFDLGEEAGDYTGNCPPALERRYLASYVRGLGIHRDALQLDYDRLRRDLDAAQRERATLLDEEPDEDEVEDVEDDIEDVEDDIESLEERLAANLDERRDVNARLARWSRGL